MRSVCVPRRRSFPSFEIEAFMGRAVLYSIVIYSVVSLASAQDSSMGGMQMQMQIR